MASTICVTDPVLTPLQASMPQNKLGSKVVENRGKYRTKSPVSRERLLIKTLEHEGGDVVGVVGVVGSMGLGESILGDVAASCSTSTMPPTRRHSISAATAHYEALAAEAGIDPDVDEINIEDLTMYRLGDDSGSNYEIDDDSDGNEGSLYDDASLTKQKLAHKERSIMQMVDILTDRLASLDAVAVSRFKGCKSDLDEYSDFRSSRAKNIRMITVNDEGWNTTTPRKTNEKSKRGNVFNHGGEGGDGGDSDSAGIGTWRMAFGNAPQTDAGRKLAHRFEQEYGSKQASNAVPKFKKNAAGKKSKRAGHYKKRETRKQERLHLERKLQLNLEQYATRAVTELVYRAPEDIPDDVEGAFMPKSRVASRQDTAHVVDGLCGVHATVISEHLAREQFPIALGANEMNPELLLSYACERAVFPGGARIFKDFATSMDSQQLFVYMFWFIHCKFFQEDNLREQTHLLRCVANCYVRVLGALGKSEYKDCFFKHYPSVIANAALWGFHYLCPGSRHLYSNVFKHVLYLQCARVLSGADVSPLSTVDIRTKLFPDETVEAFDELEYQSQRGPGMRFVGAGTGSVASLAEGVPTPSEAVDRGGDISSPSPPGTIAGVGPGKRLGSKGDAAAVANEKERNRNGENDGDNDGGVLIQRMTKTFRPNPLGPFVGDQSTLSFKPRRLEGLTTLRLQQQRTVFDTSQISPMLQEYMRQSSSTVGRRPECIIRTAPVAWCQSGGTDTFRRNPSSKELHDSISAEHVKAKRDFARSKDQATKSFRRTLRHIDADQRAIFGKGPRQVGLKSMAIVTDLQQHGALKRVRRTEH